MAPLRQRTAVVYVSPLKALSNDVQKNLEMPLREIQELALARGYLCPADPHRGAHRRYPARGAAGHAQAAAAYSRHHA